MNSNQNKLKVATDLSWAQLIWATWFVVIASIVFIIQRMFGSNLGIEEETLLTFMYRPSKIFMLVIGIISVSSFLTFYVKQGVTRKAYFYGAAISSAIVSVVLMFVIGVISFIAQLFTSTDVTATFLGADAPWLLIVIAFSMNILVYNLAGWLIGSGFYRYGVGGFLYIVLAIVFISISDFLWEFELANPLKKLVNIGTIWEVPLFVSFIGTFVLFGIALWIIRATTKRVQVDLK